MQDCRNYPRRALSRSAARKGEGSAARARSRVGQQGAGDALFAAFIIASVYADGTLDEAEYALLLPGLIETFGNDFGFEDVKAVIENSKKEGRQLTEFTDALCDYFGLLSEELKDDLVLLSLLVCAVDGKVSKKEKRYLRQLIR